MNETPMISKGEEEILVCIGYIVMRWNYAERCARQIIRSYVVGDSLDDAAHLKLSSRGAKWIEDELKNAALPKWGGTGRKYLEALIHTFAAAREHRNHFVHGIYDTFRSSGPRPALGLLMPTMPWNNRTQLPSYTSLTEMRPIANHLHELAIYAQAVMVGFDSRGEPMLNPDGSPVLAEPPSMISPLPPLQYATT
jgi:hypothetical protein